MSTRDRERHGKSVTGHIAGQNDTQKNDKTTSRVPEEKKENEKWHLDGAE